MAEKQGKKAPPALDPLVQSHIGRRLRSMFDEVASQPVPDRFLELLDQLESGGPGQDGSDDGGSGASQEMRAPAFGGPK